MYRSRTERKSAMPTTQTARLTASAVAVATLGVMLGGCSDLYFDRRDTIVLGGGDAVAADQVMQMNDPWPPQSGNTAIATNGQRMQSGIERYRTNVVTQPVDPMQLQVANQAPPTAQTNSSSNNPPPVPSIAPGTTTTTTTVVTAAPQPSQ